MCWLAASTLGGQDIGGITFGVTGKFFYLNSAADVNEVPLPTGVSATKTRPTGAYFNSDAKSRMFLVGGWSDNLVFTELYDLARQGIVPPTNPFVNASGTGSAIGVQVVAGPGITGEVVCYVTWYDARNRRRSALSGPSPTLSLSNEKITWSNLPTVPRDPTVTHVELWRAVDGNSPRLVLRRDLGTLTVTEALATGLLGEAITEDVSRFPRCRFNQMWHDRQAMAGDDRHPERVYFSPLNDPENYGGLFLRTRKGERVVGLVSIGDFLVVLCPTSSYVVTGYTEDDLKMDILEPEIGGIAHHLCASADGWAIIPSHRGIYLCTGSSMHLISKEFQHTWRKQYAADQDAFENAWAVNDLETNTYKLCVQSLSFVEELTNAIPGNLGDDGVMYWVLDYTDLLAETGGGFRQPALMIDRRIERIDECAKILRVPGGRRGHLYVGSNDGLIRQENVAGAGDGDIDLEFYVRFGHQFFGQPGGTPDDGWQYSRSWIYARLDAGDEIEVTAYGGDEQAWLQTSPLTETLVQDAAEDVDSNPIDPQCVYPWEPMISGRGLTLSVAVTAPGANVAVYGHGGVRSAGKNNRASTLNEPA